MRSFFLQPIDDLISSLERIMAVKRLAPAVVLMLLSMVVVWFVYVPVHELLHVAGCVVSGGTVSELQVAPQYGGAILARIFPFVVSGGEYAGRLSGFDWKGSDLIYLATDFGPFLLTLLIGVPLMKACTRRRHVVLFGAGLVIGFAPIYSIPGDYYEMGSILTTRAITAIGGGPHYLTLRSDDVFKLVGEVISRPEQTQVDPLLGTPVAFGVIFVSLIVGLLLALATYACGSLADRAIRSWILRKGALSEAG